MVKNLPNRHNWLETWVLDVKFMDYPFPVAIACMKENWRLCVTREEPELLRDFGTTLFNVIFETQVLRMVSVFYAE